MQKAIVESEKTRVLFTDNPDTGNLSLTMLSEAVEQAVVIPRFHDYKEAVAEADRAVRAILDSSSNINMETIIQNRNVNNYLKSKQ